MGHRMIDLSPYYDRILSEEDRTLFEDAVKSAASSALRAAYVMIWLACAESLKRRFREAQRRDESAGKIVGQIEAMEEQHKSVDKFVLDKAHEYGFLSGSALTVLSHVYDMRCIYGHPYEEAPSDEQVSHAAASVVEHVLSLPVKLRYGFADQLLKSLLEDRSYLDDESSAVRKFAVDILPRIDEQIHAWLLEKYWTELEAIVDDSSMGLFFRRGICFSRAFLDGIGIHVFSEDQWHDKVSQFPKILSRVLTSPALFSAIGQRAQDYLVGAILDDSRDHPTVLRFLERLQDNAVLSKRQEERFLEVINLMKSTALRAAGLTTRTCFEKIITALKSHDWYIQNPAVDLVAANGADGVAGLDKDNQVVLGRNILQAAEGNARSAMRLVEVISEDPTQWPMGMLRGMMLECFTNEDRKIRFKDRHLKTVLDILDAIDAETREAILDEVIENIGSGTPKYQSMDLDDFSDVVKIVGEYEWAGTLGACLEEKTRTLFKEGE